MNKLSIILKPIVITLLFIVIMTISFGISMSVIAIVIGVLLSVEPIVIINDGLYQGLVSISAFIGFASAIFMVVFVKYDTKDGFSLDEEMIKVFKK